MTTNTEQKPAAAVESKDQQMNCDHDWNESRCRSPLDGLPLDEVKEVPSMDDLKDGAMIKV